MRFPTLFVLATLPATLVAQELKPLAGPVPPPSRDWLHDGNDHTPDWAPDGRSILFSRNVGEAYQLFSVAPDGSDLQQLTFGPGANWQGAFSPDGRRMAFRSTRDGEEGLYVSDLDGSNAVRVVSGAAGEKPAWSPDGRHIAFYSNRNGPSSLWIVDADGDNLRPLRAEGVPGTNPAWSPDGTRIAFNRDTEGSQDIWTIRPDGSQLTRLTSHPGYEGYPAWSPDGSRIAFIGLRSGGSGIYTMDADGTNIDRLTNAPDWNFDPHWSPDGSQIVFDSRRDGVRGLWVMDADGTDEHKITATETSDFVALVREVGARPALAALSVASLERPEATFFRPWEVILLAREKVSSGEPGEAALLLEEVVRRHAATRHVHNDLRAVYEALGRPVPPGRSELIAVFDEEGPAAGLARLARASFDFPGLRILTASDLDDIADSLEAASDLESAIGVLRVGVAMYPLYSEMREELGNALIRGGLEEEGMAVLREAFEMDPDDVELSRRLSSGDGGG